MYATFVTSFLIRVVARGPLGAGSDCGRCNVLRKTQLKSYPSGKPSNVNLELFLMIFDNPNNEHIFSRNHSKS
jgi:hypothetical protein